MFNCVFSIINLHIEQDKTTATVVNCIFMCGKKGNLASSIINYIYIINFHFKMAFKSDRKILSDSVSKESNVQMFQMYIFHKVHIVEPLIYLISDCDR